MLDWQISPATALLTLVACPTDLGWRDFRVTSVGNSESYILYFVINMACSHGFMLVHDYAPGYSTRLVKTRYHVSYSLYRNLGSWSHRIAQILSVG